MASGGNPIVYSESPDHSAQIYHGGVLLSIENDGQKIHILLAVFLVWISLADTQPRPNLVFALREKVANTHFCRRVDICGEARNWFLIVECQPSMALLV
ncbi:hypothetical protein L596_002635 [Steinernema carpocapsae]|uniref:Uncharacterized protein n=1 Tax=Steinernema carpocapsae TaxID=34508 RepID=A0A4V6I7S7_STECR|nr:hypothetical protein L596_002635 [Steinernema carpocapsae]